MKDLVRLSRSFFIFIFFLSLISLIQAQPFYFQGRVYVGDTGVEPPNSSAYSGATVSLYGSYTSDTQGTLLGTGTTYSDAWYSIGTDNEGYNYYNLILTVPSGYTADGATGGTRRVSKTWIQIDVPQPPGLNSNKLGNKFWIKETVSPAYDMDVYGNGNLITYASKSPSSYNDTDFGSADISGGIVSKTYTIESSGTGSITISNVTISGTHSSDFLVISSPGSPVAAGATTTFTVQFDPGATGIRSATVNISNSTSKDPYDFAIQGTGTESGGENDKDYSDAPNDNVTYYYPTLASNNGAFHYIDPDVFLGLKIDEESDGIPTIGADGDDTNNTDDEDGVVFVEPLIPGQTPRVDVTASIEGYLAGWLDFNQDGDWDSTEFVFSNQVLTPGVNVLAMAIPSDALPGTTYGRFRFSTSPIYSTLGSQLDGEVEDYQVEISEAEDGSIIIIKEANPADDTKFLFCQYLNNSFFDVLCSYLQDPSNNQLTILNPSRLDSIVESETAGWILTDIVITGDTDNGSVIDLTNRSVDVDHDPGENIIITFKNRKLGEDDQFDFGDAPSPYPTLLADSGAYHLLSSKYKFGSSVDADLDGQPDASCLGDDNDGNDDEQGYISQNGGSISLNNGSFIIDPWGEISIGFWFDWDQDGSWVSNGGVFTVYNDSPFSATVDLGLITFNLPITPGVLNARVRIFGDTLHNRDFKGYGGPGEVEDYQFTYIEEDWQYDYGDAPSQYPITLVTGPIPDDGGRHPIVKGVYLGSLVDEEPDGQPDANAAGDDNADQDDEDGILFTSQLVAGQSASITATASTDGYLNAFIDLNQDGDWDDTGERVLNEYSVTSGSNNIAFNIPSSANAGDTYARFRFSTEKLVVNVQNSKRFIAKDGEVEDYKITVVDSSEVGERDYGDAPSSYPSASHITGGPYYGPSATTGLPDAEDGTLSFSPSADWDDNNGIDDEDGFVSFSQSPIQSHIWFLKMDFYNPAKQWITMGIWVDTDRDGDWDSQDAYNNCMSYNFYSSRLCFMIPSSYFNPGLTTFRARIVEGQNINLTANGDFGPGEVEDHQIILPDPGDDLPEGGYIFGRKWHDKNGDGLLQASESLLSSWTIYIDSNGNGQYDAGEPTQVTDGSGYYLFSGLAAGTYTLGEVMQLGWVQTFPGGSGTHTVTVSPSVAVTPAYDFGNKEDGTSGLGGIKWPQAPLDYYIEDLDTTVYQGWRETSTFFMPIVADDWFCYDPRPVTAIRWWGAYSDWDTTTIPENSPGEFHIGVWTDLPRDEENEWSHPGTLIHEWTVSRNDIPELAVKGIQLPECQDQIITAFQYTYDIPNTDWFYQEGDSTVYWLSITAMYEELPDTNVWGWLTREHHFLDDAVRMHFEGMPQMDAMNEDSEPIGYRWDQAFILGTEEDAGEFDFGDAPQMDYATLQVNNGAYHRFVPEIFMGETIDTEEDGIPNFEALGDDQLDTDDEDGVQFTETLIPGQENEVAVTVSCSGYLNAWLDVHCDGNWHEPEDHVLEEIELEAGEHMLSFFVPEDAVHAGTYFRFRFTREPNVWFNGFAMDGEVEDYMITISRPVSVEDQPNVNYPTEFMLKPNYPNPFNPETTIQFSLPEACDVQLTIYNIRGEVIRSLIDSHMNAGWQAVRWNGINNWGQKVSSGIYFYHIQAGEYQKSRKLLLMR